MSGTKTANGELNSNEVIFWDKIIPRKNIRDINLENEKAEYRITDINNRLRGRNVTVNLWIEHIPVFGWIHRVG